MITLDAAGDCDSGEMGAWGRRPLLAERRIDTLADCARVCHLYCARCHFVSFSERNRDCSWYRACDLRHLHRDAGPANGESYRSVAVRSAAG